MKIFRLCCLIIPTYLVLSYMGVAISALYFVLMMTTGFVLASIDAILLLNYNWQRSMKMLLIWSITYVLVMLIIENDITLLNFNWLLYLWVISIIECLVRLVALLKVHRERDSEV